MKEREREREQVREKKGERERTEKKQGRNVKTGDRCLAAILAVLRGLRMSGPGLLRSNERRVRRKRY
ncbi:hypothetical protein WN55_08090 [Dufourea novaeangliae]|uniref:Uncharacterized protein n=1 Tax=Dufourea novaeangliae TaxID=178035 RepID=A0A154P970_DUFNO|nr:hypothetical protein WN55_08090 [Dufourea novaeangliae]